MLTQHKAKIITRMTIIWTFNRDKIKITILISMNRILLKSRKKKRRINKIKITKTLMSSKMHNFKK
jgi:hypothetical protein